MSRFLMLLRHAKSAWDTGAATDFDRPLAGRGGRDAPVMGSWLKRQGLVPDVLVCSPAMRARQTAEAVCRKMGIKKKKIRWDDRVYAASVMELLKILAEYKKEPRTLMLVGHNPGLEELLRYLAGEAIETPADGKLLPTAAVAYLQMPDDWKDLVAGAAQPMAIQRVKEIAPE